MSIGEAAGDFFSGMRGGADDTHTPDAKWNTLLGDNRPEAKVKRQEDIQREFAQMGLQWRVKDAIAAGIHPLAALGFQGPQYSPVMSIDGGAPPPDPNSSTFSNMSQSFGRAMASTMTKEQRLLNQLQLSSMYLDLEGKTIDNQIRASELRRLNQTGPPMPSPLDQETGGMSGQGNFKVKPSTATSTSPGAPHQQAGAISDMGFARTSQGGYVPVPSQDVKERIEDNLFHEATHFFRNNVIPNISGGRPPDPKQYPLPKGYDVWRWSWIHQQYMPAKANKLRLFKPGEHLPSNHYYRKGFGF